MTLKDNLYWYKATITDIHDGDTIRVDLDKGLTDWNMGKYVRFARINAPELLTVPLSTLGTVMNKTPDKLPNQAGLDSKAYLESLLKDQKEVYLRTNKTENYGRLLAEVYRITDGLNLNDAMVQAGFAVYVKY